MLLCRSRSRYLPARPAAKKQLVPVLRESALRKGFDFAALLKSILKYSRVYLRASSGVAMASTSAGCFQLLCYYGLWLQHPVASISR